MIALIKPGAAAGCKVVALSMSASGSMIQVRLDIGNEHLAVGISHRGPTSGGARGTAAGGGAARGAAGSAEPCGEQASTLSANGTPGGITHDSQTEGYVIVSGGGTLVTGGHVVN